MKRILLAKALLPMLLVIASSASAGFFAEVRDTISKIPKKLDTVGSMLDKYCVGPVHIFVGGLFLSEAQNSGMNVEGALFAMIGLPIAYHGLYKTEPLVTKALKSGYKFAKDRSMHVREAAKSCFTRNVLCRFYGWTLEQLNEDVAKIDKLCSDEEPDFSSCILSNRTYESRYCIEVVKNEKTQQQVGPIIEKWQALLVAFDTWKVCQQSPLKEHFVEDFLVQKKQAVITASAEFTAALILVQNPVSQSSNNQ